MSTTVQVCLTNTGTSPLGPNLNIYSNPTSPLLHGALLEVVPTTTITGNNCPYLLVVPNTTTTVRIFDPLSFCYVDILVTDSNVCQTCSLNFSTISNNLLSTINVGVLTGTCDNTITDYRISWYGPNNSTLLAFTSGQGNIWTNRNATQPITPSSPDAPFLQSGTYVSKITEVELNGVKFSSTGGPGSVLSDTLLTCTNTVNVSSYNCSNGTYSNPYYKHFKNYVTDGLSTPQSLTADFTLSAGTPSFIWGFQGFSVYDTLKLTFSGSAYSTPIVLENINLGSDVSTDLQPTTFPKSYGSSSEFRKITRLNNIVVNNNDKIFINITPNPSTTSTSWSYKFGCYGNPTATKTCLDSYRNKPYKINKNEFSVSIGTCSTTLTMKVSGCSSNDNSGFFNSDLATLTNGVGGNCNTDNTTKLSTNSFLFSPAGQEVSYDTNYTSSICSTQGSNSGTINIYKTNVNELNIFCSDLTDLQVFFNEFNTRKSEIATGYINNPASINYYRFFRLVMISNSGNFSCGDGTSFDYKWLHYSSTCVTGTTTGGYLMTIQTPLITYGFSCPTCLNNCSLLQTWTDYANGTRNSLFNYNNTCRGRIVYPYDYSWKFKIISTSAVLGGTLTLYAETDPGYSTKTYASSNDGLNTLYPTLSGTSWDWINHFAEINPNGSRPYYRQEVCKYRVEVTSYSPFTYKIYATPIVDFLASGTELTVPVYDSTNPSAFNSTYVY